MLRLVGDIETDGFLDVCTQVHCIVLYNLEEETYHRYNSQTAGEIDTAIVLMNQADELYFHYGHGFDYPALKKLYPDFNPYPSAMFDTIDMAKAIYRDIRNMDFSAMAKGKRHPDFAKLQLVGKHSLKAWGYRLGILKGSLAGGDGTTDWSKWTPAMEDYCVQDVAVTVELLKLILADKNLVVHPMECHRLDNRFQHLMSRQERQGFTFNQDEAINLHADVSQQLKDIENELQELFPPFYKRGAKFIPKRGNQGAGYLANVPLSKVKLTEFNPGSTDHIEYYLKKRYGWQPTAFTADGKATLDESTVSSLPYPCIPQLLDYMCLSKFSGQLAAGKKAWLGAVRPSGRIHGRIDAMGTNTWRCSHSSPNLGQVPGVKHGAGGEALWGLKGRYGANARSLFGVPQGHLLCGNDASGLELRCLGHYVAALDGGEYAREIVEGDVHTKNQLAIGLNHRSNAKTWIYAFLYGAQDFRLGITVLEDFPADKRLRFHTQYGESGSKSFTAAVTVLGKGSRVRISKSIPALSELIRRVKEKSRRVGHLIALDGRRLEAKGNSAFNFLLQSCGAILMKQWLVIVDELCQEAGLVPYQWKHPSVVGHYEYVANVHDEAQTEVMAEYAEQYSEIAIKAFPLVQQYYNFRCPLDGTGAIGATWFDTH